VSRGRVVEVREDLEIDVLAVGLTLCLGVVVLVL
jgi:hypothetical protein